MFCSDINWSVLLSQKKWLTLSLTWGTENSVLGLYLEDTGDGSCPLLSKSCQSFYGIFILTQEAKLMHSKQLANCPWYLAIETQKVKRRGL